MTSFLLRPARCNGFRVGAAYTIVGCLIVGPFSGAFAHHVARFTYDVDRVIELEGEITRVLWRNPHIRLTLKTVDSQRGETLWDIESIPVTRLTRSGIRADVLNLGERVKVAGFPARRPVAELYAVNILLPDGREVLLDTPVARWTNNTIGVGRDVTPGTRSSDSSLGIFRVWSTDGENYRQSTDSYPLTDKARADQAEWDPLDPNNPFLGCMPKGMPQIMGQPNPIEFVDRGDEIILRLEEFDTVRAISMKADASEQPPTPLGHSLGRWEGNTLVVATNRVSWPHFGQSGLKQSEAIEIVERFIPSDDGARLDYELTVTDSSLFTEPLVLTKSWIWVPGDQVLPFGCTEG